MTAGETDLETDAQAYQHQRREQRRRRRSQGPTSDNEEGTLPPGQPLSAAALAKLNRENEIARMKEQREKRRREREEARIREREEARAREMEKERERARERGQERTRSRGRSRGGVASETRGAGWESEHERRKRDRQRERDRTRERSGRGYEPVRAAEEDGEEEVEGRQQQQKYRENRRSKRVVSGVLMEEGKVGKPEKDENGYTGLRASWGTGSSILRIKQQAVQQAVTGEKLPWYKQKKKLLIYLAICFVLFLIVIIVGAAVIPKVGERKDSDKPTGNNNKPTGLDSISRDSIPADAPDWLNPFTWADTTDFNLTYTDETVGDLPVMGLFTTWDDSARANEHVPPLKDPWGDYGKRPARGVNLGGWLSLEPFITPSLFNYDRRLGIVDEYTLCQYLGERRCAETLEKHYATFVTEDTFREIAEAGLDHVRIPFSYWAVQTYDGEPYLFRTSWRYLLRGIEWCRKYGLRVNLDLHALPGSQNGWNHSGRLGAIGWLNGTNGELNAQRSLEIHDRLSKFFSQPRYHNIITHYGLANEPKMTKLDADRVIQWTEQAANLVRRNGISSSRTIIVFGDGFRGLHKWQGQLQNVDNAALDVHQYVIFNNDQIVLNHSAKVRFACESWTEQTLLSMDRSTGFGPTLVAEWSQADTDCAKHLTNVGWGNRWTGTYVSGDPALDATSPRCPTQDRRCSCELANAPPSQWSESYKKFLKMFAEAQMSSFEKGWGWWYWVWDTEDAYQWSYKKGLEAGVLPKKAYERDFDCDLSQIPSFSDLPEYY